jgi:hypothetical protein
MVKNSDSGMLGIPQSDPHHVICDTLSVVSFQITDTGHDENWYKALLHGTEGYIPKNYVRFTLPW